MKIIIRQTKFSDINQVSDVNIRNLPENYNKNFWIDKFYSNKNHCFVAVYSCEIIGYIFGDNEFIISLAVEEKFRSKGIGKQLLLHCLNTYSSVKLQVRVHNETAINLYKSLGFVKQEKINGYYLNPIEDAFVMKWDKNNYKNKELLKYKINIQN